MGQSLKDWYGLPSQIVPWWSLSWAAVRWKPYTLWLSLEVDPQSCYCSSLLQHWEGPECATSTPCLGIWTWTGRLLSASLSPFCCSFVTFNFSFWSVPFLFPPLFATPSHLITLFPTIPFSLPYLRLILPLPSISLSTFSTYSISLSLFTHPSHFFLFVNPPPAAFKLRKTVNWGSPSHLLVSVVSTKLAMRLLLSQRFSKVTWQQKLATKSTKG